MEEAENKADEVENVASPHSVIIKEKKSSTMQQAQLDSEIFQQIKSKIQEMKTTKADEKETNESLVHKDVRQNNLKRLKLYQKLGASFHSFNLKGQTPQQLASEQGFTEICNFLEENIYDPSAQDLRA